MELILATHNLHKLREFRELLKPFTDLDILSLHNYPNYKLPPETGTTFQENALIKARDVAKELKKWALADDSGLVVPMLKGEPGVYSARYAGENATDTENRKKLLKAMQQLQGMDRAAYFECCLALCSPEGIEKCFTGICEGIITTEEKGSQGFGYDALFMKHDYDKTFAQIPAETKNRVSHRGKAIEKLAITFESMGLVREK